jgi:hypothetical protein
MYTLKDTTHIHTKMYAIPVLAFLTSIYKSTKPLFENIITNLSLIEEITLHEHPIKLIINGDANDFQNLIVSESNVFEIQAPYLEICNAIVFDLENILKIIFQDISVGFNFSYNNIDEFLNIIRKTENKYKMLDIFNETCKILL